MEKIALIDGDSIIHSAFYGNKVADDVTGEPKKEDGKYVIVPKSDEQIEETLDGILHHIFNEGKFTHYILFVKGKNTIVDRLKIYPEYKQGRPPTSEKWDFTKEYSIKKWGATEVNELEVDDAIRICSRKIPNSHIVSIDKDLLWLTGENFNWRKNEWTSVSDQEEEAYLSRSIIIGDTVDNIKGLFGKGEAYCNKNDIKFVWDAFKAYIIELGLQRGVDEFYKNFKTLYILEESEKYKDIPTPIKIEQNDNGENRKSRSATRELYNT